MINYKSYKVWQVRESDYPSKGGDFEKLTFLLRYGLLAPSTFNSQPWKCKITKNKLTIFLDFNRVPRRSDKEARFAHISIGCFIANLIVASAYFKLDPSIKLIKHGLKGIVPVAQVHFSKKTKKLKYADFFKALTKRATNRSLSLNKKIPDRIIKKLKGIPSKDQKIIILDHKYHGELINISYSADIAIWSDKEFRKEHTSWVRNNLTKKFDGMPAFGVGIGLIPSFFASQAIESPFFARFQAKKNIKAIKSSHHFGVLVALEGVEDWIRLGITFELMSLYLSLFGIAVSPLGQFIENKKGRENLWRLIKSKNPPQLFFRLGYPSAAVRHSPRLNVEKILI